MQFAEEYIVPGQNENDSTIKGLEERKDIQRYNSQKSPRSRSLQPGDSKR